MTEGIHTDVSGWRAGERAGETAGATLGPDGRVRAWTGAAERLTGWAEDDVSGRPLSVLFADDAGDAGLDEALETARREGFVADELRCERPSGERFLASVTLTPRERGTDDAGYTAVVRDETERARLAEERHLLAEASRAVATAESFADGVESALASVCRHTQWAYGEAWRPGAGGDALEYVAGYAADEDLAPFPAGSESATFPAGEGLPGRVYDSRAVEWIPDVSAEPETVFHRTDLAAAVGLQAAVGVPIVAEDGVVAVLTFFLRESRPAESALVDVVADVAADLGGLVARKATEDALDRERALLDRIFETSPVALLVTDRSGRIVRANGRAEAVFGRDVGAIAGETLDSLVGGFRDGAGDPVPADDLPVARVRETGDPVSDVDLQFTSPDGGTVWVSTSASPIRTRDGTERVTVAVEDVTDSREREQSLRTFREAVEHAGHSIYVTDTDGTVEYVNRTFEETTGYDAAEVVGETPNVLNSGEHDADFFADLWETILDGEVWTGEVVNERASGEQYVVNQTVAPIVDETGRIERFVAVNDDVTDRKRRERTLRRQRNTLERIRVIIESLRPLNRELARVDTRREIDRAVCRELATSDAYLFAWIGGYNAATGEIDPRERAGVDESFLRDLDLDPDGADALGAGPFARAVADRDVHASRDVPTAPGTRAARQRAVEYGFQSVAAVPVTYGGTVLAVVGVYSARPDAFDRYERELLRELGERVGHAINAAENRQLLHTDTVVELEFDVGAGGSALASLAADLDCRLSLNNVTPGADGEHVYYVEVDGAAPATVGERAAAHPAVTRTRVVRARGETGVVEVGVEGGPVPTLFEHGATIRSFEANGRGATVLAEVAPQSDVGTVVADLEAGHEGTVFVAKRTLAQDATTLRMTEAAVRDSLTDRQLEALSLAYHAGFFASPRHSTGEDLADALGISAPTFYQHVRKGIRKTLGLLLDDADAPTAPARI